MKGRVFILVIVFVTAFSACRNSSKKNDEFRLAGSETMHEAIVPDNDFNLDFSVGFSSPIEIANLLQVRGVPFSQRYLASSLEASNQVSSFDKALAMGILGANLGYLNIYEKTGNSIEVLASIKKLAEDLRVGQFFDFETIKRLSLNNSSLDSLLYLSIDSYNKIDNYLREDNRSQLSSLMLVGAWIEAQYFATQVMKTNPDELLRDRIGEQKYFLADLIKLVEPYCDSDEQFGELCRDLREIYSKYETVKITYTRGEPVKSEKDGGLLITQTETSRVEMTDQQLGEIIDKMGMVRNKLISKN